MNIAGSVMLYGGPGDGLAGDLERQRSRDSTYENQMIFFVEFSHILGFEFPTYLTSDCLTFLSLRPIARNSNSVRTSSKKMRIFPRPW